MIDPVRAKLFVCRQRVDSVFSHRQWCARKISADPPSGPTLWADEVPFLQGLRVVFVIFVVYLDR
jgi:hypothetical protein